MRTKGIGGVLDLRALALLHRPTTRDELVVVVRELAGRGMAEDSIATATGLAVEEVRRILAPRNNIGRPE